MNNFNDPFEVETFRNTLAKEKKLSRFKLTYSTSYPEVTDFNSNLFWNEKFRKHLSYRDQDAMTREKIDTIISFIPKNATTILDLGIGQGYIEERLKKFNYSYELYGIDISTIAIKRAKQKLKGNFIAGNVLNIEKKFKYKKFDVIIAVELIEHIPPSKIFSLYRQVYNLLNTNGAFIISTPLNEGLFAGGPNPSGHVRAYTIPILKAEFKLAGFTIKQHKTFFAFRNFYTLKRILSKILKTRWKPNNIVIQAIKI